MSEFAEMIRVRALDLIPKLKDCTIKEMIKIAHTKQKLIDDIITSHDDFHRQAFHTKQRKKMNEQNYEAVKNLKNIPTHEAIKYSMVKKVPKKK